MNASKIAGLLARAQAVAPPRITTVRRVRPIDGSSPPGFVFAEEDGWVCWRDDAFFDHISRANYLETET